MSDEKKDRTPASQIHENGWISVSVPPRFEQQAKTLREQRDKQYRNIYPEADTDQRWIGDLGEIVFKSWLKHRKVEGYSWVLDGAAGSPDFILSSDIRIGCKTVKRKGPPHPEYTAQITARHAHEPIDYFFFMTYEFRVQKMWLLGGIDHSGFLASARFYRDGEWVHPHYQVRGHDIYNLCLEKLTVPLDWLSQVTI
jgi:hypothetical protein